MPFIAMEYVPGETLARIIRERRAVGIERRIRWMEELCDGLAYAHEAGIVHRDVKPANLMVDSDGELKILDFGVARVAQAADLTQEGSIIGTLNYMSPEQVTGQDVDRRSDVFAVGAVLYEMLSYRQAFPGSLSDGVLHDILHGEPEPLAREPSGIDAMLVSVVERAMSKDPEHRYPDLVAMKSDLQEIRGRLDHPAVDRATLGGASWGSHGSGVRSGRGRK
jgi:eukaryotic-like serine/threonine-protein kinase